jgi:maltose alpha-D-glucosyltransferase/alpha-amylase
MNHTSDQHPWFQASRAEPDGPFGDFYVWSDTDDRYGEARVIFVDTEQSNWTFDPVRGQYYWHRFFSHQPDLNYENPAVAGRDDRSPAVLARPRHRRLPAGRGALPVRAGGHQLREPQGNARVPEAGPGRDRPAVPGPGAAGRSQPVAGRRGGVLRRPRDRRRRVPHGVPLPADAAHLHGGPARAAVPDLGDHGADPADPLRLPVGHLPAQPRRADARDGHRRRARLHVPSTPRIRG